MYTFDVAISARTLHSDSVAKDQIPRPNRAVSCRDAAMRSAAIAAESSSRASCSGERMAVRIGSVARDATGCGSRAHEPRTDGCVSLFEVRNDLLERPRIKHVIAGEPG